MISSFLPAFFTCLICSNSVAFCCNTFFIFFIALHYNKLFLLTEVGGMQLLHFMQKMSQMTRQTPPFMGTRTEPDEENLVNEES